MMIMIILDLNLVAKGSQEIFTMQLDSQALKQTFTTSFLHTYVYQLYDLITLDLNIVTKKASSFASIPNH
jgi:hypothetical protein